MRWRGKKLMFGEIGTIEQTINYLQTWVKSKLVEELSYFVMEVN
jgi:hypothetical protein